MQSRSLSPRSPRNWKENVCLRDVGVFLAFPGSSEFGHLATSTGCGSDIRVCQSVVTSYTNNFPKRYGICVVPSWRLPSQRVRPTGSFVAGTRPPTPGLETPDRLVAGVWLSCSELVCRQGHVGHEHPPTLHNGMCEGHQGPDRDGVLHRRVSPHHLT